MKTKICTKCEIEKSLSSFYNQKTGRLGVTSICKLCSERLYKEPHKDTTKKRQHDYYMANKEKSKKAGAIWRANNIERDSSLKKIYYKANQEKIKAQSKKRYQEKKEEILAKDKLYRKLNKEKIKARNKAYSATHREESNLRRQIKGKTDLMFRLNRNISSSVAYTLKGNRKGAHWETLVGYTVGILKEHLERQFAAGMSWDNYGKWHIDHKIPVSVFNFTKPEHDDFKKCWGLKNLQPMWALENISKGAKLDKPFQPSLLI